VRLVVTGATGGLGRAFLDRLPAHHQAHAFAHADLDVGDFGAVQSAIPALHPDAIVNLAAFTKVDACESEPERAYRDNTLGPHNLALAARACGATLLHVSTDFVFDGEKGSPYDELDEPGPLSIYGRSKLAGEERVRDTIVEHIIVRTGFVFGGGEDYLSSALAALRRGETAGGIADRVGTPTDVREVAARLVPLLLTGRFGTYHLCGPEATTWFDVLGRLARIGKLAGAVESQRSADLGLPARRPPNSSMTSLFLGELGIDPMPSLDESLADLVRRTSPEALGGNEQGGGLP
jgi:dTDP-4-dehydrorhamnose reductase